MAMPALAQGIPPTVGEAMRAIGLEEPEDRDLALFWEGPNGSWPHSALRTIAHRNVDEYPGLRYTSIAYPKNQFLNSNHGRTQSNAREILELGFDIDLSLWLGCSPSALWPYDQEALDELVGLVREDVERVFGEVGLPFHRVDYTGYGINVRVRINPADRGRVSELVATQKRLITRINQVAGQTLIDAQTSDAATRGARVPQSLNQKGGQTRRTRTLWQQPGSVTLADLGAIVSVAPPPRRPAALIPEHAQGLSATDADGIVAAVAPSWGEGSRHAIALYLSGMLAKAGVPESQALSIVERLAGGEEDEDRRKTVQTTYEKTRQGVDVGGYQRLRQFLPEAQLAYVDETLARLRQATTPRILVSPQRQARSGEAQPAVVSADSRFIFARPPQSAFYGMFGEYLDIVGPCTEAADAFHLGAGLTTGGTVIGRRVGIWHVSSTLFANLFTLLVGYAGSARKDTAIHWAAYLPDRLDWNGQGGRRELRARPYEVFTDIGSAEGLISLMSENPGPKLLYSTEFNKILRDSQRKSTSTLIPTLTAAWNNPRELANNVKGNPLKAEFPFLSMIAAVQPSVLADEIGGGNLSQGFMSRFMVFPGTAKPPMPRPPDVDERAMRAWLTTLLERVHSYEENTSLRMDDAAGSRWDEWYVHDGRRATRDEDEDAQRSRLGVMLLKVALLFAVSDGDRFVRRHHVEAAITLVEWMWEQLRPLMGDWGAAPDERLANRIRRARKPDGGPMSRRRWQQATGGKGFGPGVWARIFDSMLKNGEIVYLPDTDMYDLGREG